MSSAFLVTFIFLLASKDLFLDNRQLVGEQKLLVGTVTLMAALGFLMVLPDIMHQIGIAVGKARADKNGPVTFPASAPPIITTDMELTGPKDAPFTIVEFADYQCPHCAKASVMMSEELGKNPKRYRFAFRNYPLPMHHWGVTAALAAEAAGEQGKYWQMHDLIFAHQAEMDNKAFNQDEFSKFAEQLGLNQARFETDEGSDKLMSRVANDSTTARIVGVQMTPTFFIFNRKGHIFQLTGLEKMKEAMDDPDHKAWH
jgi:protein-disulfide isomerase